LPAILLCCCLTSPCLLFAAETKRRVLPFATQEIRYHMLEASEVFLIWWVNDGNIVSEGLQPPGTVRKDGTMYTPMTREDDTFVVRLQVPMGTIMRYVFQITKARDGTPLEVWDTGGSIQRYFQTVVLPKGVDTVWGTIQLLKEALFVTQEIRYALREASEVFLVWSTNDWTVVPEVFDPPGTVRKDGAMYTPMTHEDDTFVMRLQVPMGTIMRYAFQITKARGGTALEIWDTDGDPHQRYQVMALPDSVINLRAGLRLIQDWPLASQEIRYHMPEASAVFLVWGIDDWTVIPETFHPPGTIATGALLHTPMTRVGDTFVTTVSLPLGAGMYYGFEITEIQGGVSTALWDANGERDYHLLVSQNSVVEVQAKLTSEQLHVFTADSINRRIWLLVLSGIVGPAIGLWYVVRTRRQRQRRRRRRHTRRHSEWPPVASAEATPASMSAESSEAPNVALQTPAPRARRHRRAGKWTTLLPIFRRRRRHRHRRHASRYA
jgi:hypothetical protein